MRWRILRVRSAQITASLPLPPAASSRPSGLNAILLTSPTGPRRSGRRRERVEARQSVTRLGAGEVANSDPSGLNADAVDPRLVVKVCSRLRDPPTSQTIVLPSRLDE